MPPEASVPAVLRGPPSTLIFDPLAPTVFHQPWWLSATTDGHYGEAVVMQSGRKVGYLPYAIERLAGGQTLCCMPRLTPVLGPAVIEGTGAAPNRVLRQAQIIRELLAQLPRCSGYRHTLHRGTRDTMVYQEHGYETSVRFTFEVAPAPPQALWRSMREPTRALITQGESRYRVRFLDDDAVLKQIARHAEAADPGEAARRACRAAIGRGQGLIVAAETLAGVMDAAILVVWDAQAAYCVLTTRRHDCARDVMAVLLWRAMQACAAGGLTFDLGCLVTARPDCLAGFGGQVSPRYAVSRYSAAYKVARRLRAVLCRNVAVRSR